MTAREAIRFARNSGAVVGAIFGAACGIGAASVPAGIAGGVLMFVVWPGLLVCGATVLEWLNWMFER